MPRKYNYGLGDYGSTIRDQALIIALLSENNLENSKLVMPVLLHYLIT